MRAGANGASDVSLLWLLVIVIGVAGYVGVVSRLERDVRVTLLQANSLYDLANRNERLLGESARLEAASARVRHDIAQLNATDRGDKATVALLRVIEREAKRRHVIFVALSPDESAGQNADGSAAMTIELRGGYADVLGFAANLSRQEVLVKMRGVEIEREETAMPGQVRATLHAALYHGLAFLSTPTSKEVRTHAQAALRE